MSEDLVIVGAGGFARETAAAVQAINAVTPTWRLRGFLDDDPALHGSHRGGVAILGDTGLLRDLPDTRVVICVASPDDPARRPGLVARLGLTRDRLATVIHPSAQVGAGCVVGAGSVLLAQVVLTADATLGAHVIVMPHTVITHDDVIGDFATLTSGVRLGGGVVVEDGAYLGAGCMVRPYLRVGTRSLVGMGSVVLTDVPAGQVWVGNPARYLRDVGLPSHPGVALGTGSPQ